MFKRFLLTLFLIISTTLHSEDFEKMYESWCEYWGVDPHAGLNSFYSLIIPPGGRYEGMGTAFTAVADDIGFLESNPAASSVLDITEVSFLHNNWILDTNIETLAFTSRKKNRGLGFQGKWLYLPFTEVDDWGEREGKGYYSEATLTANFSYNFLSSYDFYGIAVGGNLKTAYRSVPEEIAAGQSSLALMLDLGVLTRFNFLKLYSSRDKNFSAGITLKNYGKEFIELADPIPTQLSGGIAWKPIRPWLLAFDAGYRFNLNPDTLLPLDALEGEGLHYAVGTDFVFSDFFSVHGGFLIKEGNPRITAGAQLSYLKTIFVMNYTLDLTTSSSGFTRFSIEAKLDLGDFGRAATREKVQELYINGLEKYAAGDIEEAIEIWEQCILLDDTFTPALRMRDVAKEAVKIQKDLESRQIVE